jgi:hypothetical protein
MPESDWPEWPSANNDGPWYAWPGLEPQLFPVPCDGYIWKPLESDPSVFFPVGYAPPEPKWVAEEPPTRTALYRAFDSTGTLLYVGISGSPEKRWVHHSENKAWWPEVARVEVAWHDSRAEALWHESEAIRAEKPRHNIQHNGRRTVMPH